MTDYTKDQFMNDLFECANVWTESIMLKLAKRSEELWENETARKLVRKCASARRLYKDARTQMFADAVANREEYPLEVIELRKEKSSMYTEMFYDLLVRD